MDASQALDISASLPSVSTNNVKLADLGITLHSDAFNLKERSGPVTGSALAASLTIDNPAVAPLVAGEIQRAAGGNARRRRRLRSPAPHWQRCRRRAIGRRRFAGRWRIKAATRRRRGFRRAAGHARPLLGEKVALSAELLREPSGDVSARPHAGFRGLAAKGSARLREGVIDAEVTGTLADIAPLAPQASGGLALTATARLADFAGHRPVPHQQSARLRGNAIDNLELRAAGRVDQLSPQATVALKGLFKGEALDGNAVVATTDGKREVREIVLSLGPNRITGALSLDERFMPAGSLDLDLADLGRLAALFGQSVEGSAKGSATFGSFGATPQVNVVLNAETVKRGAIQAKSMMLSALVSDFLARADVFGGNWRDAGRFAASINRRPTSACSWMAHWPTSANGNHFDGWRHGEQFLAGAAGEPSRRPHRVEGRRVNLHASRPRTCGNSWTARRPSICPLRRARRAHCASSAPIGNGAFTTQASGTLDPAGQVDMSVQLGGEPPASRFPSARTRALST